MTTLCVDLDASEALRRELRGDPRFTKAEAPAPRFIAHLLDTTETLMRTVATQPGEQP